MCVVTQMEETTWAAPVDGFVTPFYPGMLAENARHTGQRHFLFFERLLGNCAGVVARTVRSPLLSPDRDRFDRVDPCVGVDPFGIPKANAGLLQ
jgi:hypothetical protein